MKGDDLRHQLQLFADLRAAPCPEQVVLKLGVQPTRKLRSPWTGAPKRCFLNAFRMMKRRKTLLYTEGYFMSAIPIHHAWLTLPDGSIYDPTLNDLGRGAERYLGIPFPRQFVKDEWNSSMFVTENETYNLNVLNWTG